MYAASGGWILFLTSALRAPILINREHSMSISIAESTLEKKTQVPPKGQKIREVSCRPPLNPFNEIEDSIEEDMGVLEAPGLVHTQFGAALFRHFRKYGDVFVSPKDIEAPEGTKGFKV